MAKYYAVRNGYHTGIFNTWDECKKEVSGFSGVALYLTLAVLREREGLAVPVSAR